MICLSVCIGTACHLNGANNVIMTFQHLIEEYGLHDRVTVSAAFCLGTCSSCTVSVKINDEGYAISASEARAFFRERVLPLVTE